MTMTRADKKKLLLAQGALHRFECMHARRELTATLDGWLSRGPSGVLRLLASRGLMTGLTTVLPLVLGAGRVARLLKRGLLVAGGVAAAWSAISRWRDGGGDGAPAEPGTEPGAGDAAAPDADAGAARKSGPVAP